MCSVLFRSYSVFKFSFIVILFMPPVFTLFHFTSLAPSTAPAALCLFLSGLSHASPPFLIFLLLSSTYVSESLQQDSAVGECHLYSINTLCLWAEFPLTGTQINVGTHEPDLRGILKFSGKKKYGGKNREREGNELDVLKSQRCDRRCCECCIQLISAENILYRRLTLVFVLLTNRWLCKCSKLCVQRACLSSQNT